MARTLSPSRGADTLRVLVAARDCLSKLAAAAVMTPVPEVIPTICPALSTVATLGLLDDQTNTMFGIGCESAGPFICHAVAVAAVSLPRSRIWMGVMLTCTDESCSVG